MLANALEVARQVPGRGVAFLGILGQTALDDPAKGRRNVGVDLPDGLRVLANDGRERFGRRAALKRPHPRRHLVEHRAQGELIGAEVDLLAAGLLGRHVADGAQNRPGLRFLDRGGAFVRRGRVARE